MKKEEWINNVLESASEIKEVEANPYLYSKVMNRLTSNEKAQLTSYKLKFNWALVISLVIAINVSVVVIYKSKSGNQNKTIAIEALSNEMISGTTYNY